MKTKFDLVDKIVNSCKGLVSDDVVDIKNPDGRVLFSFMVDLENKTILVSDETHDWVDIRKLDSGTGSEYTEAICRDFLPCEPDQFPSDNICKLELGIGEWYSLVAECERDIRKYLKEVSPRVDVDLHNDMYTFIATRRDAIIKYVRMKGRDIVIGVSEPVFHNGTIVDWKDSEIDFCNLFQDPVVLSDFMHEFYAETEKNVKNS